MKLKDKIKSYSFWVSLASAVVLILKVLGARFGFTVDEGMLSDLFTAMCSVLVLLGIIVVPSNGNANKLSDINSLLTNETKPQNTLATTTNNELEQKSNDNNEIIETEILIDNSSDEITNYCNDTLQTNYVNSTEENMINDNDKTYENSSFNINKNPALETCENIQNELVECIDRESESKAIDFVAPINNNENCSIQDYSASVETQINDVVETVFNTKNNNLTTESLNENLVSELKQTLEGERNKFSDNLQDYIFELESELKNLRGEQN